LASPRLVEDKSRNGTIISVIFATVTVLVVAILTYHNRRKPGYEEIDSFSMH
jgi:hypothetical protein